MHKKILICLILFLGSFPVMAQFSDSDMNWKPMLSDVKVRYIWSVKHSSYITRARFGEQVQKLDGQEVTLKGFFLAADLTGNLYVLSSNPMATCFFCSAAGIETVVEMEPHPDDLRLFKRLRTDNFIEVKGTLHLNPDDYQRLIYILKDVRLVKF
jgi:hypothetical protein